jgi:hypothetical protein
MTDKTDPKNANNYFCEICDFNCCKKSNFEKHLLTLKHKNTDKILTNTDAKNAENANTVENMEIKNIFTCDCGKEYKHRQSLFNHKKNCKIEENKEISLYDKDQLIVMLIKQNSELMKETSDFKSMMMEVIKNGTHNTTHTNSHNKAFNLNFFLNETCKDAMNITDFVDSIKLQLSDLEGVGELGYVEGISNIIIKNLKGLDVTQRPVHCTDKKRETMYIKDEDKWEKDEEKKKLHKVVRKVTCKNQNLIPKFKEKHPDCNTYHSKFSDQYNKIIIESMGGKGDNEYEKEEKIIKNISKQVFIDKGPL